MTILAAMVTVGPGTWTNPFAVEGEAAQVAVPAFRIDLEPVTNAEYRTFLEGHPAWRKGSVSAALADDRYLARWDGPASFGALAPDAPVTEVSWFAAEAYCEARGATLPTTAQWELAASGHPDGRTDEATARTILDWYARPDPPTLPPVGQGAPNGWGARDLHGLVWEWVLDFNAGPSDPALFCGGGAGTFPDPSDVATRMRFELRSSLKAAYTTANLGFRCARSP